MIQIIKNRKWWFAFSGTLILASLISIVAWQFKFGIDFTGGSLVEVQWKQTAPSIIEVHDDLRPHVTRDFVIQPGEEGRMVMRLEPMSEEKHQELSKELRTKFGDFEEVRFDSIGPVIGQELAQKSIWALLIVLLAIVAYVAFSFRTVSKPIASWKYGVITMLTGFHDVIIPLGLFSLLGHFRGTEVNAAFIAATLTILGYSVNDTIVVLDRVRENLGKAVGTFEEVVERSVHQTFVRSVSTSLTTLLALCAVYFFGGASVKDLALALIVGIATGTYSSIFIASPLLVTWNRK